MAYHNCSYPAGYDSGEYNLNHNHFNYDSVPAQSFMGYSSYDHNYEPSLYSYPQLCFPSSYHESSSSYYSNIAYSANIISESNLIEYYPAQTQLVISHSTLKFNEPDFEEYDPTPYDGGYDITDTYGKPLPPSDETCYPRSTPDTPAYGSIPVAKVEDESIKLEPTKMEVADEEKQVVQVTDENDHKAQNGKTDERSEESREDSKNSENVDAYSGEPYYVDEKIVPPPYPSGYGLETLDLCESLFGYWPCLSRMKRFGNGYECNHENLDVQEYKDDIYRGTADYIFGGTNPYGGMETEDGRSYGGDTLYAYYTHYPAQSL